MSLEISEEKYKEKYLKYKAKYLKLNKLNKYKQQGGLFNLNSGYAEVFTSMINACLLKDAFKSGTIKNKESIAVLLDKQAYIIFDSDTEAKLIESTSRIIKEQSNIALDKSTQLLSNVALTTGTTAMSIAKTMAATASDALSTASNVASNALSTASNAASNALSTVSKAASDKYAAYQQNKLYVGGEYLDKIINTENNISFNHANQNHIKDIKFKVASALNINADEVESLSIIFKIWQNPELIII